jgi:hypothetical protein
MAQADADDHEGDGRRDDDLEAHVPSLPMVVGRRLGLGKEE